MSEAQTKPLKPLQMLSICLDQSSRLCAQSKVLQSGRDRHDADSNRFRREASGSVEGCRGGSGRVRGLSGVVGERPGGSLIR